MAFVNFVTVQTGKLWNFGGGKIEGSGSVLVGWKLYSRLPRALPIHLFRYLL